MVPILAIPVLAGLAARGQLTMPLAATSSSYRPGCWSRRGFLVPCGSVAQGAVWTAIAAYREEPVAATLGFALLYSQPSFNSVAAAGAS